MSRLIPAEIIRIAMLDHRTGNQFGFDRELIFRFRKLQQVAQRLPVIRFSIHEKIPKLRDKDSQFGLPQRLGSNITETDILACCLQQFASFCVFVRVFSLNLYIPINDILQVFLPARNWNRPNVIGYCLAGNLFE